MRDEFTKHKRSDSVKWIITFIAIILLSLGVIAAITQGFRAWDPYGWFKKEPEEKVLFQATFTHDMPLGMYYGYLNNTSLKGLNESQLNEVVKSPKDYHAQDYYYLRSDADFGDELGAGSRYQFGALIESFPMESVKTVKVTYSLGGEQLVAELVKDIASGDSFAYIDTVNKLGFSLGVIAPSLENSPSALIFQHVTDLDIVFQIFAIEVISE